MKGNCNPQRFLNSLLPITMGKMKAIEAGDAATADIPEASFQRIRFRHVIHIQVTCKFL